MQDGALGQYPSLEIPPLRTPIEEEELGLGFDPGDIYAPVDTSPMEGVSSIIAPGQHRAPTGFQGGGATFGALPAGLQDQGGLTVGLEALGRGENPSEAWQKWKDETSAFTLPEELPDDSIPSFQYGGVVPGEKGEPTLIQAHAGEMVIPNPIGGNWWQQSGMLGDVWRPDPSIWGREVSSPARGQIPSQIGGDFRFRSPQTIRRMTPTQRRMFQEGIKSFGYPWEDFSMQERMAASIGGPRRPSIQFRRPSFVRG
jgi:hypothetical protein